MFKFIKFFIILFLLCSSSGYTINFFDNQIKDGQKIAIYPGAFDPIHLGHDEVIRYALSNNIDYVIIVLSKFDPHKPFMTSIEFRNILLNHLYDKETSILTTNLNYQEVLDYLLKKNVKITAIIGSDNFIRFMKQNKTPKLNADTWLIIPRDKDKDNFLLKETKNFDGKPVLIADVNKLQYQGYSSTNIRNILRAHAEFYQGLFNPPISQLPIDYSIRNFIRDFRLYKYIPSNVAESNTINCQIIKAIKDELNKLKIKYDKIINAQRGGIIGFSGNLIFFITDCSGKKIVTIKVFVTNKKDQEITKELNSIELFNTFNLKYSKPIKPIFSFHSEKFNLLGMQFAQGKSFESILQDFNNVKTKSKRDAYLKKIEIDYYILGQSLAELHMKEAKEIKEITIEDLRKFIDLSHIIIKDIELNKHLFPSYKTELMQSIKEKLTMNILQNPGYFSYLHGDLQPGNFFIDNQNEIIMIDLAGAAKHFDNQKNPKGFAAYEYYRFLTSFDFYINIQRFNLEPHELTVIKKSFIDGYKANITKDKINLLTQESLDFFKFYWNLRSIQGDLIFLRYMPKINESYQRLLNDLQFKLNEILELKI